MIDQPRIIESPQTRLIGVRVRTSFVNDRTSELWRGFRPVGSTIGRRIGNESYSVKIYDASYSFSSFDPAAQFDKWAAVVFGDEAAIPDGMECLIIPAGKYAEFINVGPASAAPKTFGYIFGEWRPSSGLSSTFGRTSRFFLKVTIRLPKMLRSGY